jgi:hypothetical protein
MNWRSLAELGPAVERLPEQENLTKLYAASRIMRSALRSEGYSAAVPWQDIVKLTPKGQAVFEQAKAEGHQTAPLSLAILAQFAYTDLLVDHTKTDVTAAIELVDAEIRQLKIRLPYRYGRLLYDRFNDGIGADRTDHLDAARVNVLLAETPQGVFQLGKLLTGPLGLLEAGQLRNLPPIRRLPLWHCSDTGCAAVHDVELLPNETDHVLAGRALWKILTTEHKRPSEWDLALRGLFGDRRRSYFDLPCLIADSINGDERTALTVLGLEGPSRQKLREVLRAAKPSAAQGSPKSVSKQLDQAEQLQLLLTLDDTELVRLLDSAIYANLIKLPPSEVRSATWPARSVPYPTTEMSALGVRSVPYNPASLFAATVARTYSEANLSDDLKWKLRRHAISNTTDALIKDLTESGPAHAVHTLVLSSQAIAKKIIGELICTDNGQADTVADRIAWKFGFNVPRFEDTYSRFRQRLERMRQALLRASPTLSEDERETLRSFGVNVFVSVEEFLTRVVSYITWLLGSDHFVQTRYRYSLEAAIECVPTLLGATLSSSEDIRVTWNTNGENTLGTLMEYFTAMVEWIKSRETADKKNILRPEHELPHFEADPVYSFPFRHTQLWADADPTQLTQLAIDLQSLRTNLVASDLAAIRNGLDHQRDADRFPSVERMLACVSRLSEALSIAQEKRLVPKVWWRKSIAESRDGTIESVLEDDRGNLLQLLGPSLVIGLRGTSDASVVAPGFLLGTMYGQLQFRVHERSEWSQYWEGYPRRRRLVAQENPNSGPSGAEVGEPAQAEKTQAG